MARYMVVNINTGRADEVDADNALLAVVALNPRYADYDLEIAEGTRSAAMWDVWPIPDDGGDAQITFSVREKWT